MSFSRACRERGMKCGVAATTRTIPETVPLHEAFLVAMGHGPSSFTSGISTAATWSIVTHILIPSLSCLSPMDPDENKRIWRDARFRKSPKRSGEPQYCYVPSNCAQLTVPEDECPLCLHENREIVAVSQIKIGKMGPFQVVHCPIL